MPSFNSRWSALALVAPLIGCASQPEGPPIVLHPRSAPKVAAHRPALRSPAKPVVAAGKPAASPNVRTARSQEPEPDADTQALSAAQKEELFRRFDAYLSQPGHQQ